MTRVTYQWLEQYSVTRSHRNLYSDSTRLEPQNVINWLDSTQNLYMYVTRYNPANCIASFQINPHWISNSGLWKGVPETSRERPGKLTKGVLFHQDNAPAHKSVVAMAAVRDCGFELVDHPPKDLHILLIWLHLTIFRSPTWIQKHLAGKQYQTDDEVISAVEDFFEDQDESFRLYHGNPSAATPMEKVCGPQGKLYYLKNNAHLVKFDHCLHHSQPMNFSAHLRIPTNNWLSNAVWKTRGELSNQRAIGVAL